MSQPANDDFSQHLSDDEASYHEDASENGTATNKPKQQQQQLIPTTTTISNIKLPILKKEEYDIWALITKTFQFHIILYLNDIWANWFSLLLFASMESLDQGSRGNRLLQ
ncbi:hypothetical protein Tco_0899013 [Tanacetum coccineum]